MVVEMTALQGIMGGHYAGLHGEPEAVCRAIAEQYETVSATRKRSRTGTGDRIDSLVGLTAAGLPPGGSNDPFGLRRAAIQIIENLAANAVSPRFAAGDCALPKRSPFLRRPDIQMQITDFIATRLEVLLRENGNRASVVKAVLAEQAHDPANAFLHLRRALGSNHRARLDNLTRCAAPVVCASHAVCHSVSLCIQVLFALAQEQTLFAAYGGGKCRSTGRFRHLSPICASWNRLSPASLTMFL